MASTTTTLDHSERFLIKHQERCGVDRRGVIQESDDKRRKMTLTCPTCRSAVGGSVRASDWSALIAFLDPRTTVHSLNDVGFDAHAVRAPNYW